MAPQIYDGKVIVGSSGGEWPIRGFVAAIDAKTGEEVWRWHATDPDTLRGRQLEERRRHGLDDARPWIPSGGW